MDFTESTFTDFGGDAIGTDRGAVGEGTVVSATFCFRRTEDRGSLRFLWLEGLLRGMGLRGLRWLRDRGRQGRGI